MSVLAWTIYLSFMGAGALLLLEKKRAHLARGLALAVAAAALAAFVAEVKERPLHAFVARHNVGSIRVLEKCQFVPSPEHDPSIAGEDGVHEVLYMLSRPGGLARRSAKPEGKKRGWVGWSFTPGGGLPPSANFGGQAAALPGAIIMPPLRGSEKANNRVPAAPADTRVSFLSQSPGTPDPER